jgi:hypothetical protein
MTVHNRVAAHPLASYGGRVTKHLVAEDAALQVALGGYYTRATILLDDFTAGAVRGAANVSNDFKPEARAQKQRELLRAGAGKVRAALDDELQRLAASAAAVRDELHKAANPPPSSENALLALLQEQELRRELARLEPDERRRFVREAARRGDVATLRAVERSPVRPLIPDVDLQRAKAELLEVCEPALVARAEQADALVESARRTAAMVERHLRVLARDGGLDAAMLRDETPRLTAEGERLDRLRRSLPWSRDYVPPEEPEPEAGADPAAAAAS